MVEAKKKISKKKTSVRKKPTVTKKTAAKKKTTTRKKPKMTNRKTAATSRHALTDKLKQDLKATKEALNVARVAAREELKLATVAAKDEIAVLKDQLAAALNREKSFIKLSEQKAKKMLVAGERWEKKQIEKIKKAAAKTRKKK